LPGGEDETTEARLLSNPIEFDGIKTGVVDLLPDAEELNPHISQGEICAASKFLWKRNLARPTGKNGKTKVVVPFFRRG
jgi:hypothetical protein